MEHWTTRPVSVPLPTPLADAFRLLAERGLIGSVSVAPTRALEDALQAVIVACDSTQTSGLDAAPPR